MENDGFWLRFWGAFLGTIAGILIVLALIVGFVAFMLSSPAISQEMSVPEFFAKSKSAELWDGKTRNCCGVGDFTSIRIVSVSSAGALVEVTDPRRHSFAKPGERHFVPRSLFVVHPEPPLALGNGMFLSLQSDPAERKPLCLSIRSGG